MAALISALVIAMAAEAVADPSLTNEALTAACATQKCRPAHTVMVNAQGTPFQSQQPPLPFVVNDRIIVVPGDEFDVELDWDANGGPAHVTLPGATGRPDHTVHVTFEQREASVNLTIKNGTSTTFKYDARMELPGHGLVATSSCPVMANIMGIETWSDPIFKLVLSNLRPLPKSNQMVCN